MAVFVAPAPAFAELTTDPLAAPAEADPLAAQAAADTAVPGADAAADAAPLDAEALSNPLVLCGSGYLIVSSDGVHRYDTRQLIGTVYLLRNPGLGRYCGVTVKYAYTGAATRTSTYVWSEAPLQFVDDDGPRLGYAGPVAVDGSKCAVYGGAVSDPDGNLFLHDSANAAIGGKPYCPSTGVAEDAVVSPV